MKKNKRVGVIIILFIIFILLIILIKNNSILKIDNKVYNLIAKFIKPNNTKIFKVITFFGSTIFMIVLTLCLSFILWKSGGKLILITMLSSTIINNLVKVLIARDRPNILPLANENSYSFPSGHTMAITSLIGIILYLLWHKEKTNEKEKRRGLVIVSIILSLIPPLIMLSRIYLGVHYFSDCLGGYILSIIIILIISIMIDNRIKTKK